MRREKNAPRISQSDLNTLNQIFAIFDEVIFNHFGEMVAVLTTNIPVFGNVTVSYFIKESHLKVFPANSEPGENDFFNGLVAPLSDSENPHRVPLSKDQFIDTVKSLLKQQVADTLQ